MKIFRGQSFEEYINGLVTIVENSTNTADSLDRLAQTFNWKAESMLNAARQAYADATKSSGRLFADFGITNPLETDPKFYIPQETSSIIQVPRTMVYESGVLKNAPLTSVSRTHIGDQITASATVLSSTGNISYLTNPDEMFLENLWVGEIFSNEEITIEPSWLPEGIYQEKSVSGAIIALHISLSNITNFNEIYLNPFTSMVLIDIVLHGNNGKSVSILDRSEFIELNGPTTINIPRTSVSTIDDITSSYGIIGNDGAIAHSITLYLSQPNYSVVTTALAANDQISNINLTNLLYEMLNYKPTSNLVFDHSKPWSEPIERFDADIKQHVTELGDTSGATLKRAIDNAITKSGDNQLKYQFGFYSIDVKNSIRTASGAALLKPIAYEENIRYMNPIFDFDCYDGLTYNIGSMTQELKDELDRAFTIKSTSYFGNDLVLIKTVKPITKSVVSNLSVQPIDVKYTTDYISTFISVDDNTFGNKIDPSHDIFIFSEASIRSNPKLVNFLLEDGSFNTVYNNHLTECLVDFEYMVTDADGLGISPKNFAYQLVSDDLGQDFHCTIKYMPDRGLSSVRNFVTSTYKTASKTKYLEVQFMLNYMMGSSVRIRLFNIGYNGKSYEIPCNTTSDNKLIRLLADITNTDINKIYVTIDYLDEDKRTLYTIKTKTTSSFGALYEIELFVPKENKRVISQFRCETGRRFKFTCSKFGNHIFVYVNDQSVSGYYFNSLEDRVINPVDTNKQPNSAAVLNDATAALATDDGVLSSIKYTDTNIITISSLTPNRTEIFDKLDDDNTITLGSPVFVDHDLLASTKLNPNELVDGKIPHPLVVEFIDNTADNTTIVMADHHAEEYYSEAINKSIPSNKTISLIKLSANSFQFPHSKIGKGNIIINVSVGKQSATIEQSTISNLPASNIPNEQGNTFVTIRGGGIIEMDPYSVNYSINFNNSTITFTDYFISKVESIVTVDASYTYSDSKAITIQRQTPYTRNITHYFDKTQTTLKPYSTDYPVYEYLHFGQTIKFAQPLPPNIKVKVLYPSYGNNVRLGFITHDRNASISSVDALVVTEKKHKM